MTSESLKNSVRQLVQQGKTAEGIDMWRATTGDDHDVARLAVEALVLESLPGGVAHKLGADPQDWTRKSQATARFGDGKGRTADYARGQIWIGRTCSREADAVGFSDNRHIVTIAGSRSGKGTTAIIPNLCDYPGSVICIDPKGENASVTARRRANGSEYSMGMGQEVVVLDPFNVADVPDDLRGSYNPLDLIDPSSPDAIDEAAAIAEALVVSSDPKDVHWTESARQWITALVLYVTFTARAEERDLDMVRMLLTRGIPVAESDNPPLADERRSGFEELIRYMRNCDAFHGAVAAAAETMAGMGSDERGSVLSFARRNTAFIDSPRMKAVTSKSTFSIDELKTAARGLSIYLCLPVKDLGNHGRWLRLMVMVAMRQMERLGHKPPASGHPVLFVLDEFASLGYMRPVEQAIGYIAGFGVKLWIVLQDLQQLQGHYERSWSTFLANAAVLQAFANNDQLTLEYLSKRLGDTEVRQYTTTESRSQSRSDSTSKTYSSTTGTSVTSGRDDSVTRAPRGLIFRGKRQSESKSKSRSTSDDKSATAGGGTTTSFSQEEGESVAENISIAPLLRPDEIERRFGRRSDGRTESPMLQLVIVSGDYPLILQRIDYFDDPQFEGKFDPHPAFPNNVPLTLEERARLRREAMLLEQATLSEQTPSEVQQTAIPPRSLWVRRIAIGLAVGIVIVLVRQLVSTDSPVEIKAASKASVSPPAAPVVPPATKSGSEAPKSASPPIVSKEVATGSPQPLLAVAALTAIVRDGPSVRASEVGRLVRGTRVKEVERGDNFVRIVADSGMSGWLAERTLINAADADRLSSVSAGAYIEGKQKDDVLSRLTTQLQPLGSAVFRARNLMRQLSPDAEAALSAIDAERALSLPIDVSASRWFIWSAEAARNSKDYAEEARQALAGIYADPTNAEHFVAFALAKYQLGEVEQLHEAASFLPFLAPTATNTWVVVGISDALKDRPDQAVSAFHYALRFSKKLENTRSTLSNVAQSTSDARVAATIRAALVTKP